MSKIEVDQVDPQSGTNLTLGTSGDSILIPSGVTLANSGTMTGVPAPTSGVAASAIDSGTIATARLGSGTASSSTFLRGDQTYAEPGGGSWILIDTQTVSGTPTSIEPGAVFSATYDTYVVIVRRYNNVSGGGFHLQLGTSGGYTASGYKWSGSGVKQGTSLVTGSSGDSVIDLLGGTSSAYHVNSSQDCLGAVIWFHNPFNSGRTEIHAELAWENATGAESQLNNVSGHPGSDTQYDRWKLICPSSSQTFEATTIIQTFGVINA